LHERASPSLLDVTMTRAPDAAANCNSDFAPPAARGPREKRGLRIGRGGAGGQVGRRGEARRMDGLESLSDDELRVQLDHAKAASDRAEGQLSAVEDDGNLRPEVRDELGKTASALEELVSALSAEIARRRTSPS
jgi:hypothetical protein